jgi:hypothetical protein
VVEQAVGLVERYGDAHAAQGTAAARGDDDPRAFVASVLYHGAP